MKIISADIYEFSLPLHKPLNLSGHVMLERKGLMMRLVDSDDKVGWGEASPLPGFSNESLPDALSQLETVAASLVNTKPEVPEIFNADLSESTTNKLLFPSVRFAMESALASLWAAVTGNPLGRLFSEQLQDEIAVNALLIANASGLENRLSSILEDGFTTIKIKVGSRDYKLDAELVNKIMKIVPSETKIRLDANRKWNFEQACIFSNLISEGEIEFIEEPLDDNSKLSIFIETTGMSVALDETLCEIEPKELYTFGDVSTVVLKPTLLGGFNRALAFQRAAKACETKVVLSSSFESGLSILALSEFASAVCEPNRACGFDTLSFFKEDTISGGPLIVGGKINLKQFRDNSIAINAKLLRSIKNV